MKTKNGYTIIYSTLNLRQRDFATIVLPSIRSGPRRQNKNSRCRKVTWIPNSNETRSPQNAGLAITEAKHVATPNNYLSTVTSFTYLVVFPLQSLVNSIVSVTPVITVEMNLVKFNKKERIRRIQQACIDEFVRHSRNTQTNEPIRHKIVSDDWFSVRNALRWISTVA